MKHEITVQSVVIDYPEQVMKIKDINGDAHTISLDTMITVTMVGYPDRMTQTIQARNLDPFMMNGYIIENISF